MNRKHGKDKYINLIPDLEEFMKTYTDIENVISFTELTNTTITVNLHPFRISIFKLRAPGRISIFTTYNGYILVSKLTYEIQLFNTEVDILCIKIMNTDIMIVISEKITNNIKMLFVKSKYIL
jgi:hypothetical protein